MNEPDFLQASFISCKLTLGGYYFHLLTEKHKRRVHIYCHTVPRKHNTGEYLMETLVND